MEIKDKIKTLITEIDKKKEELNKIIKESFGELIKTELFEKYDYLHTISWNQYTPYFNDGESCEFQVNHNYIINGYDNDFDINDSCTSDNYVNVSLLADKKIYELQKEGNWIKVPNPKYNEKYKICMNDISNVLSLIPDEYYADMFGDHVEVEISRIHGTSVEEFEHD
jgi:hypothetical protein